MTRFLPKIEKYLLIMAMVLPAFWASNALSQEATKALEEIVVTARKRE